MPLGAAIVFQGHERESVLPRDDRYAWTSNLELRRQLRIGTILETQDCGYYRVVGIVDEGILAPGLLGPAMLASWHQLERGECIVWSQPSDEDAAELGAGFTAPVSYDELLAPLVEPTYAASPPGVDGRPPRDLLVPERDIGRELIERLAGAAPPGWERIVVTLSFVHPAWGVHVDARAMAGSVDAKLPVGDAAQAVAERLVKYAKARRGEECVGITFELDLEGDSASMGIRFRYERRPKPLSREALLAKMTERAWRGSS